MGDSSLTGGGLYIMAKFFYKMQNILNIKYKLEDQAKSAYSEAQRMLDEEEEKLEVLKSRQAEYELHLKGLMESVLDIAKIRQCEDAVEVMKYAVRIQMISVKNAQLKLEAARVVLNEAMADRKIHEKLKESAFEVFKEEIKAEEKKEVDELVSFKYSRTTDGEDD